MHLHDWVALNHRASAVEGKCSVRIRVGNKIENLCDSSTVFPHDNANMTFSGQTLGCAFKGDEVRKGTYMELKQLIRSFSNNVQKKYINHTIIKISASSCFF